MDRNKIIRCVDISKEDAAFLLKEQEPDEPKMIDMEKVIKGLEICIKVQDNEVCPKECPYRKDVCYGTSGLMADALALLKEQEARVLTLEEVLGGDECWVEYINGGCGYCDCYLDDDAKSIVINRTLRKDFNVSPNGYGKVWRCWSARPTDEQRKAVKWE